MKKFFLTLSIVALSFAGMAQNVNGEQSMSDNKPTTPSVQLNTFIDSVSYAVGRDVYMNFTQQDLGFDIRIVAMSLLDCVEGKNNWDVETLRPIFERYQVYAQERQQAMIEENKKKGEEFLEKNKLKKSIKTTESGLQYEVVKEGNGKRPEITDIVKVHYTGKLLDGKVFDSSVERGEPLTFPLQQVIPGWSEGVQLMDEGAKYILYIPYELGYGEQPVGEIPPASTLIFEVELLEINPAEEAVPEQ